MARFTDVDRTYMARALELARAARGRTFPNPAVGAVIVSAGAVVGEGSTSPAGGPHAERTALRRAGVRARGSTLYVTLEPCCHVGRTPPCTDAIVTAGVRRVVAALRDPNPQVAGRGVALLRRRGVEVSIGLLGNQATELNEDFFHAIVQRRAWIGLKLAMSLDGRIADGRGRSQWITGPAARRLVHDLRRVHAAVAIGRGTLTADDPRLTVRHRPGPQPARIVFTSGRLPSPASRFRGDGGEGRRIAVVSGGRARAVTKRTGDGLEIWHTGTRARGRSLRAFAEMAFEEGLTSVLVEGGSHLASSFLEHGLVNRVWFFYGNHVLGGGLPGIAFARGLSLARSLRLTRVVHVALGDDWAVTGLVTPAARLTRRRVREATGRRARRAQRG